MKRSWLNRKPGAKGLARKSGLARRTRLSTSRKRRTDPGQESEPSLAYVTKLCHDWVKERDNWCCQRCQEDFHNRPDMLGVSHYYGVRHTAVRFDERNLDSLCHPCHTGPKGWEYRKSGEYRDYMLEKLGPDGFEELRQLSLQVRKPLREAKTEFLAAYHAGTIEKPAPFRRLRGEAGFAD